MLDAVIKYVTGRKCHFYMSPAGEDKNEIVVLVHGLIRRSLSFYCMGKYLRRHGYHIYVYDYQTSLHGVARHGQDFKAYLEKIVRENPGRKINIVTHSMGGIITREALGHLAEGTELPKYELLTKDRFKRIVMLAPPNYGSDVAKRVVKYLPFSKSLLKPLEELSSAPDSYIHKVPVPQGIELGIIAGKFDRKVRREYTRLPGAGHHIVLNSEHSCIMYMPKVKRAVLHFLETGTFF